MIKPLKVTMIVYAVLGIVFGLGYIFAPDQLAAVFGHDEVPALAATLAALLGASFIAACVFLIVAARDPLKHILWVKYAILFAILMSVTELYSTIKGYNTFGQAATGIILHAVIAAALLAFYPWSAAGSDA